MSEPSDAASLDAASLDPSLRPGPALEATAAPRPWAEMRAASRADRAHWRRRRRGSPFPRRAYHAVWLYRVSRYAHERGWRTAAWFLWLVNGWWTGADLPPSSRIAGGLFLAHPLGVIIAGAVGREAAFGVQAVIGGLLREPDRDVGGGPGLPILGDGITLEAGALVLGAVRVGDRVRIGPRCLVLEDVGSDAEVRPADWRPRPVRSGA